MAKRIIPNLYITLQEGIEFDSIRENSTVQNIIFTNVFLGIKEANKNKLKEATIVELNSSGNYVTIPKENWKISLEKAQSYFANLEEYEKCDSIQKLIKSIDSYGTERIHRTSPRTNKSNNRDKEYPEAS